MASATARPAISSGTPNLSVNSWRADVRLSHGLEPWDLPNVIKKSASWRTVAVRPFCRLSLTCCMCPSFHLGPYNDTEATQHTLIAPIIRTTNDAPKKNLEL